MTCCSLLFCDNVYNSSFAQITSKEHFDDVVSRAAGADEASSGGYEDAQGNWRVPHKLLMVEVHAGWCRVCKGLQPKLLKLITKHPEVICCKINKTQNEVSLISLFIPGLTRMGVRGGICGGRFHPCSILYHMRFSLVGNVEKLINTGCRI